MPLCGKRVNRRPGKPGASCDASADEEQRKDAEASVASATTPAEVPDDRPIEGEPAIADVENIATAEKTDRILPEASQRALREEAVSLFHHLRHKPNNPYCDPCRKAKLKLARNLAG